MSDTTQSRELRRIFGEKQYGEVLDKLRNKDGIVKAQTASSFILKVIEEAAPKS
jgi:hypothetical protein